jgi:CheY-like chemotaxis protein
MLDHHSLTIQSSSPSITLNKIRVLIAEDHLLIRKTFSALLSEAPDIQEVNEVDHISDLLDRVKKLKPHVLILNAHMPDGKNLFTSQGWRKRYPDVHILVLSAHERHEDNLPGTGGIGGDLLSQSVRLVAGREEWLSCRVVDILTKSLKDYKDDPHMSVSAREIWV